MEEPIDTEIEDESEEIRVHAWRVEQLGKLGLSTLIAEAAAELVDWHDVAPLVHKGCPPEPTAFVETAASILVALGHEPGRIRTERFGPTGG